MNIRNAAFVLCMLLPVAVQAGEQPPASIDEEIHQDLNDARREISADLAKARLELATGNLRIDNSLHFGADEVASDDAGRRLAQAEITPQGDLLIEGKPQAIDAYQRQQLLAYRGQVVEIAIAGMEIGQRTAEAALDEVEDSSWVGLMFNAVSGRLESRIKRVVRQQVEPAVRGICQQLPTVMTSQQQLASSLPQFRPYATLEADDIQDCETLIQQEFASL